MTRLISLVVAALVPVGPIGVAAAQLSTVGSATTIAAIPGVAPLRWPDVGYDPVNRVYLVVSGATNIEGQYLSEDGAALGAPFQVNANTILYGMTPRTAFSAEAGGFLVDWHETQPDQLTKVRGRILRYNQPALTGDFAISDTNSYWEMGAAVAYSTQSHEFLVTWSDMAGPSNTVIGQRVSATGARLGSPITVDPSPRYHRDPAVGYNPMTNEFLSAFAGCDGDHDCFVAARRIQAGTGALLGSVISLDSGRPSTYVPEVTYNSLDNQFFLVWFRGGMASRVIGADGSSGALTLVPAGGGGPDSNGLAYNRSSNTSLFLGHGTDAADLALELSSAGMPTTTSWLPVGPASAKGNFNPRVAAHSSRAEWLVATVTEFNRVTTQRVKTAAVAPTPPPVDSGSAMAPADLGGTPTSGGGGSGGSDGGARTAGGATLPVVAKGGCSFIATRPERGLPWGLAVIGGMLIVAHARRRNSRIILEQRVAAFPYCTDRGVSIMRARPQSGRRRVVAPWG